MSRRPKKGRGLKDPTEASFNKIFLDYRRKAELAGKPFELTRAEFKRLTKQNCYYCGSPPANSYKKSKGREPYVYTGIDKISPELGYLRGNVRPACWLCNNMKSNSSFKEFVIHVGKIAAHLLHKIPLPRKPKGRKP